MGDEQVNKESSQSSRVSIDTYGGKIHVEWDLLYSR